MDFLKIWKCSCAALSQQAKSGVLANKRTGRLIKACGDNEKHSPSNEKQYEVRTKFVQRDSGGGGSVGRGGHFLHQRSLVRAPSATSLNNFEPIVI